MVQQINQNELRDFIIFVREHRNLLEQNKNTFYQNYRTKRFNDKELVADVEVFENLLQSLFTRLNKYELLFSVSAGYKYKELPDGETIVSFVENLLSDVKELKKFQTNYFIYLKSKVKGDVSKFQVLWKEIDKNLLVLMHILLDMEKYSKQFLEGRYAGLKNTDKLGKPLFQIEINDMIPLKLGVGETLIILERNTEDCREDSANEFGNLTAKGKATAAAIGVSFFNTMFMQLGDEKSTLDIRMVASSAILATAEGVSLPDKRRAVDTAKYVIQGLKEAMNDNAVDHKQFLNNTFFRRWKPIESAELKDLLMFEQSPDFVKWMKGKYGYKYGGANQSAGAKFWMNYELESEKKIAEQRGVEMQNQVADRIYKAVLTEARWAALYHEKKPDRRLIIWMVSHYDSIAPFFKKFVLDIEPSTALVKMVHGSGITILSQKAKASCFFRGSMYDII
ncbi:hypothetical protein J4418_02690 [Candidatus Woesearchaeota archaeon]|nr:hypothetical protein [Candidatus Woesearchaeota archaeon]